MASGSCGARPGIALLASPSHVSAPAPSHLLSLQAAGVNDVEVAQTEECTTARTLASNGDGRAGCGSGDEQLAGCNKHRYGLLHHFHSAPPSS